MTLPGHTPLHPPLQGHIIEQTDVEKARKHLDEMMLEWGRKKLEEFSGKESPPSMDAIEDGIDEILDREGHLFPKSYYEDFENFDYGIGDLQEEDADEKILVTEQSPNPL